MSGDFKEHITNKEGMLNIINEKKIMFVVMLKTKIPEERLNVFINFAPIVKLAVKYLQIIICIFCNLK
jgi:hypothetical protein